jgi:molybdopterin biosynthesis enzyme
VTPDVIKAVVDALFKGLEDRLAARPGLLFVIHLLHELALTMLPALLVAAKTAAQAAPPKAK